MEITKEELVEKIDQLKERILTERLSDKNEFEVNFYIGLINEVLNDKEGF